MINRTAIIERLDKHVLPILNRPTPLPPTLERVGKQWAQGEVPPRTRHLRVISAR